MFSARAHVNLFEKFSSTIIAIFHSRITKQPLFYILAGMFVTHITHRRARGVSYPSLGATKKRMAYPRKKKK